MALQACECAQVCVSGFSRVGRPPRALRRRLDVSSEHFFFGGKTKENEVFSFEGRKKRRKTFFPSFAGKQIFSKRLVLQFLWYEKDLVSKVVRSTSQYVESGLGIPR